MRARLLCAGLVAISIVVIAGPAWAKASIAGANITGPGLGGGLRIEAPDTVGLWESGIHVVGGLDDTRAHSVEELGPTPADLGPRYLVTYRFDFSDVLIRQDLYPYAKAGPVTYTARSRADGPCQHADHRRLVPELPRLLPLPRGPRPAGKESRCLGRHSRACPWYPTRGPDAVVGGHRRGSRGVGHPVTGCSGCALQDAHGGPGVNR
jgi:hypothetical protein